MDCKLLRFPQVQERVGNLSRSTVWRLEKKNEFPKRRKVSKTGSATVWLESEISAWIDSRSQGGQNA
jgi:predicted DNA-binding transcriptional regulator AlpA